jgi:hypothetical protein
MSGRRDSNPQGLVGAPPRRNVPMSAASSFQSCNVYQFRHARSAWCLRSGGTDLTSPSVSSSSAISVEKSICQRQKNKCPELGHFCAVSALNLLQINPAFDTAYLQHGETET